MRKPSIIDTLQARKLRLRVAKEISLRLMAEPELRPGICC